MTTDTKTFPALGSRVTATYHGTPVTGVVATVVPQWGGGVMVNPDEGWTHNGRTYEDGIWFGDATTSSDAWPVECAQ